VNRESAKSSQPVKDDAKKIREGAAGERKKGFTNGRKRKAARTATCTKEDAKEFTTPKGDRCGKVTRGKTTMSSLPETKKLRG